MADFDEVQSNQNMMGSNTDYSNHTEDVSTGEKIARFMSGGRDEGQRALYNATRAGAFNSATVPDEAGAYGGLLPSLKVQRNNSMGEAQGIADRIRKQGAYRE